ncbi:MAG: tetratricopeptide repeat protein [Deltaproteobacteria bacterium]|nr:tetratricopeptide repeat protein [Deltaproteobacteria bacterium]
MKYRCIHCDEIFDFDGEGRPRCPKCMRVHDLQKYEEKARPSKTKWRVGAALLFLVIVLSSLSYYWLRRSAEEGTNEVPLEPLSENALARFLERSDAQVGELSRLFAASGEIERFAAKAAGDKTEIIDKTRAVVAAIRARAAKRAFVPWSLVDPREEPLMVAGDILKAVNQDGAANTLYPLEVAALTVAALRALGIDALLAEAFSFAGEHSPPDPSGRLGYFVVALHGDNQADYRLFDPYGGRTTMPRKGDFEILTDVQAVGLAVSLRALHKLAHENKPKAAVADSDTALRLASRSPTVRSARAVILVATGGVALGRAEMEAAAQIRADSPRNNNLAALLVAQGDLEQASRKVAAALEENKDFALAHTTLASIHFARGEPELGRAELVRTEKLDPNLPLLSMLWAHYYSATGQLDLAIEKTRQAVASRPNDRQARLLLASLLRQNGRYDEMRRIARALLGETPDSQKQEMKRVIERLLGPTALEPPIDAEREEGRPNDDKAAMPSGDFQLGKGLKLLDDKGEQPRIRGSLLGSGSNGRSRLRLNP